MAQRQLDPTLNTAHIIATNMGTSALTYRNKAPNDKSFSAIILGVNQKFVSTVNEDDQHTIIEKYSIPQTVDDGMNYYTFKIHGTYRIKKSNGNFKLYDNVVVRVPNGNWSDMFIEIQKDTLPPTPPKYFKSVDAPAPEEVQINQGDIWIKINNETDMEIQAVYKYDYNENDELEWIWLFSVSGGSGGVGEWLDEDHTTEIFNCYADTRWGDSKNSSVMKYDHVEGCGNSSEAEGDIWRYFGYNHLEGYHNSSFMAFYSFLGGSYNKLGTKPESGSYIGNWNTDSFIYGNGNTGEHIQNGTVILGSQNKGTNLTGCLMVGSSNEWRDSSTSLLVGSGLHVSNASQCLIIGSGTVNANGKRIIISGGTDTWFSVDDGGNVYARGTMTAREYVTSSADFAEYFEWSDGNPDAEDRMGLLVMLENGKITPAHGDDFFGAISARASVVGNAYADYWHGKYVTDVYGRVQYDKEGHALISPDFDPDREYIPRSRRPEWDVTGLVGRIIIRDDGSCKPGGYVSAENGIGTYSATKTPARVISRIDDSHIEILIK